MFSTSHLLREAGECYFEMGILISVCSLEVYTGFFSFLPEGTSVPVPVACQGWIIWMESG